MRWRDGAEHHRTDRAADRADRRKAQGLDRQGRFLVHLMTTSLKILFCIVRVRRSKLGSVQHDRLGDWTVRLAGRKSSTG